MAGVLPGQRDQMSDRNQAGRDVAGGRRALRMALVAMAVFALLAMGSGPGRAQRLWTVEGVSPALAPGAPRLTARPR